MSNRANKSKYGVVVETAEDDKARQEAEENLMETEMELNQKVEDEDSDEVNIIDLRRNEYNVDDITQSMNKQMKLSKKKKGDVSMEPTKTISKEDLRKQMKQKRKNRNNRS